MKKWEEYFREILGGVVILKIKHKQKQKATLLRVS